MSASLVGSEMCIRDRESSLAGSRRRRKDGDVSGAGNNNTQCFHANARNCLLYTSDAADDM
eukprot:3948102-Alexandrium_andersonii.AAC.1